MNTIWFAISKSIEYVLISIGLFTFYKKLGGKRLYFSFSFAKRLFTKSWHYMLSALLVMSYAYADRLMIKMMLNDTAMGYYSAAIVCANLSEFVFIAIIDSFRPMILGNKKLKKDIYDSGISALYSIVIALSLFQSVFITILAHPIVLTLYGKAYLPAIRTLQIVVWYTAFSYIGFVRNIWILSENKQNYLWRINLCGACFNVALNAVIIPLLGIEGAALSSLLTQILTNVGTGFFFKPFRYNNYLLLKSMNFRASIVFFKKRNY